MFYNILDLSIWTGELATNLTSFQLFPSFNYLKYIHM